MKTYYKYSKCSKIIPLLVGDSPLILCSGETPLEVLRPALESSAQERHGPVGAGPEEATRMIRGLEHLS